MIYAIEAIGLDRVKFGRAKNPDARFRVLSTGSPVPLDLIIVAPWPDHYEGVIHRAFADERITGEWFMITKRVERFCHAMGMPGVSDRERLEMSMAVLESVAPKCRLCHKEHYSTQRCGVKKTTPPAPLSSAVHGGDEAPPGGYSGSPVNKCREQDRESPTDLSEGEEGAAAWGDDRTKSSMWSNGSVSTGRVDSDTKHASRKSDPQSLTSAEKQKAYRKRNKERVLEADRKRKQEKRDG